MLALAPPAGVRCARADAARRPRRRGEQHLRRPRASRVAVSRGSAASAPTRRATASSMRSPPKASIRSWVERDADAPDRADAEGPRRRRALLPQRIGGQRDGSGRCSSRVPVAAARAVFVTGVTALIGPRTARRRPRAARHARAACALSIPTCETGCGDPTAARNSCGRSIERCDLLLAGSGELDGDSSGRDRQAGREGQEGQEGQEGRTS